MWNPLGLDRHLIGAYPSRAQYHRWLSGDLKSLPIPITAWLERCAALPGGSIESAEAVAPALNEAAPPPSNRQPELDGLLALQGLSDVVAVLPTRPEFTSTLPPHSLFDAAREVRIAGLSLNILCQQYADDHLRSLLELAPPSDACSLTRTGRPSRHANKREGQSPVPCQR